MLDLIDLDVPALGYTRFISAWLYQGRNECILVDPGPACTADTLFDALEVRGVRHLEWIFLTHIHLDHSGGVGHVVRKFPEARVVCHEKAAQHLIDPERLWEGSLKVLGRVAEVYGKMLPVPPVCIVTADEIPAAGGVRVIPTPGHAAHHQCFAGREWFFAGELFGIFHAMDKEFYLRPATPPVFVLEDFLASMNAAAPFLDRPLCFAHHGRWDNGPQILETARNQLLLWVEVVRRHRKNPDLSVIADALTNADPIYGRKDWLPALVQQRETYFTANAIRGILQYLEKSAS